MARVHVGVDLHKRMSQIAVLTDDGELAQHRLEEAKARGREMTVADAIAFALEEPSPARA